MIAPVLTALAMVSLAALPAPALEQAPVYALHYDLKVDAAVTTGLLVAWVGSEALFKSAIAPAQCRWCDRSNCRN